MSVTSPSSASFAVVRKLPKSPEDNPVTGSNCLTMCLYNIPRGALTIIIPALVILITGATALGMAATSADLSSSEQNGQQRVWSGVDGWTKLTSPLIVTAIGAAWTVLGVVYWTAMWCKYRPRAAPPSASGSAYSNRMMTSSLSEADRSDVSDRSVAPVELVSVYWISPSNEQYYSRDAAKNRWQYPW